VRRKAFPFKKRSAAKTQMLVTPPGIAALYALQSISNRGVRIRGDLFSIAFMRRRIFKGSTTHPDPGLPQ
jgi:hypothetical protein